MDFSKPLFASFEFKVQRSIYSTWDYGEVHYIIDDSIREAGDREKIKSVIKNLEDVATCLNFTEMSEIDPERTPHYLRCLSLTVNML